MPSNQFESFKPKQIINISNPSIAISTESNTIDNNFSNNNKSSILINDNTTPTTTTTTSTTYNNNNNNNNNNDNNNQQFSYESNPSYSYLSEVESTILRSTVPLTINEADEISVLGHRGIWINKHEQINWKGDIPIEQYEINQDSSPEIIKKRTEQNLIYIQELAIRYLKPPTPPLPGDIIINHEANIITKPAPPLIIRQQPPRPTTPDPLVIREAPPRPPKHVGRKIITISGKRLPPPPRKIVIERLAPLPSKPQSVIIERWLPYSRLKRRVIYQKSDDSEAYVMKPKNVIVQWEQPSVTVKKDFKYLGIIKANPIEYIKRYGSVLKHPKDLPEFVTAIKPPSGISLAAECNDTHTHELIGDVKALNLVDLDKEGLSEYRDQLKKLGVLQSLQKSETKIGLINQSQDEQSPISKMTYFNQIYESDPINTSFNVKNALKIISDIFNQVDRDQNSKLSIDEAENLFIKLNSRLGRQLAKEDVKNFFQSIDLNRSGFISLGEFRIAFERSL